MDDGRDRPCGLKLLIDLCIFFFCGSVLCLLSFLSTRYYHEPKLTYNDFLRSSSCLLSQDLTSTVGSGVGGSHWYVVSFLYLRHVKPFSLTLLTP